MPFALVIDDQADVRRLIEHVLIRAGFVVEGVGGARAALLRLARGSVPDLVVLDVQMPDVDGWTALRAIRATQRTADVPVVLCTVKGRVDDAMRGWKLGCDGYVAKPFVPDALAAEARRVIALSAHERIERRAAALTALKRRSARDGAPQPA